jgi:hypothetical protein
MMSIPVPPDSELHGRLKKAVLDRKKFSLRKLKDFHSQWDDADDSMKAYIPESELAKDKKHKKKYAGEVDYVTLEVPYTYAQVMTAHTYFASVFLSRSPIWQFTARHGESQDSIQSVEAIMDYQLKVGTQLPVLYNWLYDLARYSLGVVGLYWETEMRMVSKYEEKPMLFMGQPIPGKTEKVMTSQAIRGYTGNKYYNIRPYDFLPDPRVPIWKFQEGEFCARETTEGHSSILATQQAMPGYYTNVEELLKRFRDKDFGSELQDGSSRVDRPLGPSEFGSETPGVGFCKITECHIKLIPEQWQLSKSKALEIWCIVLADDSLVIGAYPLGCYHNQFPFAVIEGNFGSDTFAKIGTVEMIRPLTDVMTWLFNSHFYNVRKALNDTRVVDPSKIVMKDLKSPVAGGVIRLKPEAYGTDPKAAIHQLVNYDVTRSHVNDVQFVEQMLQRVSGIVDNIMGSQTSGGRKTATEVRTSSGWSTNRLKVPCEYNSALGFDPLAMMSLSNTQQFLDLERTYAIAGSNLETASRYVQVTPEGIAGFYDYVPVDGTMPVDRLAQANFWKELLMQMARIPQLALQWDIGAMLAHTMKLQGERNVDRFRIQVGSQQQLQQQALAGNVVPLQGAGGAGGRGGQRGAGSTGGTL